MEARAEEEAEDELAAALDAVRRLLESAGGPRGAPSSSPPLPEPRTLAELAAAFGLSAFERGVLLVLAALELQPGIDALCAKLNGSEGRPWPTLGLLLGVVPGADWGALLPTAPLRAFRLLRFGQGELLTERPVYLEERVLHALLGHAYLEPELARRLQPVAPASALPASHRALAKRLEGLWGSAQVHLWSEEPGAGVAVAAAAAGPRRLLRLPASAAPNGAGETGDFLALWARESRLQPLALVVDLDDGDAPAERAARELASAASGAVVSSGREPRPGEALVRLRVHAAPFEERVAHWHAALDGLPKPDGLDEMVARFRLDASGVDAAVDAVRQGLADNPGADPGTLLWDGARAQAHPRLQDLAQRLSPSAKWNDLVLPDAQERSLRALLSQARRKAVVDHRWGFADGGDRGGGTSAVFAGPSGTGKTMAAEVLARELGLDLFRIDLSAVVSKYIGETEKNLRRVFDAAEAGGAVLLFDEADALFGKRTEVKDSHDRHANIEVSYLLQRMESYCGLALLTTNYRKHLDDAFLRRIPFVIDFPFPDAEQRERIWRGTFPQKTPTERLDYARLAKLAVSGGSIKSVARNAAFLAADEGGPVTMRHLQRAAELEYEKLGRALTSGEVRGWA